MTTKVRKPFHRHTHLLLYCGLGLLSGAFVLAVLNVDEKDNGDHSATAPVVQREPESDVEKPASFEELSQPDSNLGAQPIHQPLVGGLPGVTPASKQMPNTADAMAVLVLDERGEPIAGAAIFASAQANLGAWRQLGQTNATGTLRLEHVPSASVVFARDVLGRRSKVAAIRLFNREPARDSMHAKEGVGIDIADDALEMLRLNEEIADRSVEMVLRIEGITTVAGTVTRLGGCAVGARVFAFYSGQPTDVWTADDEPRNLTTQGCVANAAGRYEMRIAGPFVGYVAATQESRWSSKRFVSAKTGESRAADLVLLEGEFSIDIVVVDANGAPVPGAKVEVVPHDDRADTPIIGRTAVDGRALISVDGTGSYDVDCSAPGLVQSDPVSVQATAPFEATEVVAKLLQTVEITGRVVDNMGNPVNHALVTASLVDKDELAKSIGDANGWARYYAACKRDVVAISQPDGSFSLRGLHPSLAYVVKCTDWSSPPTLGGEGAMNITVTLPSGM